MIALDTSRVQLDANATDKANAIEQVGQLLVDGGNIQAGYITSMMGREEVANTYLGNGIAIPHGLPKDRELINETGIAVLQLPNGVPWNDGEMARLVVGIAAKSDEHIEVLRRLTRVLGNKEQVEHLTKTADPSDIVEALTGERPLPPKPQINDYEHHFDAVIHNPTGLHARPATTFVDIAKQFQADIRVRNGADVADGKSMMELLQLGAGSGTQIRISAQGPQAADALAALKQGIDEGLGDEPEEELHVGAGHDWTPTSVSASYDAISAANGLTIGVVRQHVKQELVIEDNPTTPAEEGGKVQQAIDASQAELNELYEEVKTRVGSGKAAIFRAHAEFLNDASMIQDTIIRIFDGHSAAWSWHQVIEERVSQMEKLDDPVLAGRAVDLSDVGQRVLRHLLGVGDVQPPAADEPVVLVAEDLTPSDTAVLDPDMVLGFVTAIGGPTSHTAIMARSLGIPAIVAAGDGVLSIQDGTPCVLDGFNGKLYLKPSEADVAAVQSVQRELAQQQEIANVSRHEPAITLDGHQVEIAANINRSTDVETAVNAGAEGVGLMRTEFLFLERDAAPTEEEQFEAYKAMLQALDGRPLIIRTLDIGGDKEVAYLNLPKEDNSFLGIRGIRLCLARPDLFIPQLRALYRAAAYGPLKIMFPMISTLTDFEQARDMAEQVRKEVGADPVELGMMVEVPSAVVLADQFAKMVDFFSIGTNDLTQYTLAMDRLHPQLAKRTDGLHPAVLRMVDQTVRAAVKEGKWVGVCGGVAGDPKGAVILTGLGVSELSVSIPNVAAIKAQIRSLSWADTQEIAQKALNCRTAAEVRAL